MIYSMTVWMTWLFQRLADQLISYTITHLLCDKYREVAVFLVNLQPQGHEAEEVDAESQAPGTQLPVTQRVQELVRVLQQLTTANNHNISGDSRHMLTCTRNSQSQMCFIPWECFHSLGLLLSWNTEQISHRLEGSRHQARDTAPIW